MQQDSSAVETAAAEEPAEKEAGSGEAGAVGEDVPNGQEESSKSTTAAPQPSGSQAAPETQASAKPAQGVAQPFAPGDIVRVSARQRPQYDKCKAKIIAVLTGDVKVEFKFNQVIKVISTEPKSE